MRLRTLAVVALATLLALTMLAGPVAAQGVPDDLDLPDGVDLEDVLPTYVGEPDPDDEVGGIVIERPEPGEPPEAPPAGPRTEPEPDVEVLAEVHDRRLPVTGGDLLGLSAIGLVLLALGFFAIRRGRPSPSKG